MRMLVPSPDSLQIFTLTAVNGLVDRWRRTDPFIGLVRRFEQQLVCLTDESFALGASAERSLQCLYGPRDSRRGMNFTHVLGSYAYTGIIALFLVSYHYIRNLQKV